MQTWPGRRIARRTEAIELRPSEGDDDAGLGAELAGAERDGVDEALRYGLGALGERGGKKKDGVDAAHLGVDGDGDFAGGGQCDQSAADFARSGEADGANGGMLDEGFADRTAAADQKREDAFGQCMIGDGFLNDAAHEFGGAEMRGVRLCDHRAASGKCSGGIASGDGECQRKVAGAEYGDGADGNLLCAEIGARRRLAVGHGAIERGVEPAALARERSEEAELEDGARPLALDAATGKAGFGDDALY